MGKRQDLINWLAHHATDWMNSRFSATAYSLTSTSKLAYLSASAGSETDSGLWMQAESFGREHESVDWIQEILENDPAYHLSG
jgi:hypothetical protein